MCSGALGSQRLGGKAERCGESFDQSASGAPSAHYECIPALNYVCLSRASLFLVGEDGASPTANGFLTAPRRSRMIVDQIFDQLRVGLKLPHAGVLCSRKERK